MLGRDFNALVVDEVPAAYTSVHGGKGYGNLNKNGKRLLRFAKINMFLKKRSLHLII